MRQPPFGVRRVPLHLRSGIHYGYPICCVLHFCWDNALGRAAGMTRWRQISYDRARSTFVPCGFLHAEGSPFSFPERLWRMFIFEYRWFQPTGVGKKNRERAFHGSARYRNSKESERSQASADGCLEALWWDDEGWVKNCACMDE